MSIFDIDNWKEVGSTLARNKTRTFLTAFGIFWGVLMLALLWGGSQGLKRTVASFFDGFSSNSAIVVASRTTMPYKGYQKGMTWQIDNNDIATIRRMVPELQTVSPIGVQTSTTSYRDKQVSGSVLGLEPNYVDVMSPFVTGGRFLNDADLANNSKVCVIGDNVATTLFGADESLGKFIEVGNVFYCVVGTIKQRNDISIGDRLEDSVLIPLSTMQRTYNMADKVGYFSVIAKPQYRPGDLKDKIFHALRKNHPLHPDDTSAIWFMDISEQFESVSGIFSGIDILILFVGFSSLLAGIIGVGNIMWIIVKERTKEFGIRRALGAKPRSVMVQILAESAVLTTIAGTAGICAAVGILAIATNIILSINPTLALSHVSYQLSFGSAMAIMAAFLVLGSLAGTIPALKAMKIKPIEALNDK